MTKDDLNRMLADADMAIANASPGPWSWGCAGPNGKTDLTHEEMIENLAENIRRGFEGKLYLVAMGIEQGEVGADDKVYLLPAVTGNGEKSEANAQFIAFARNYMSDIISAYREAEKEIERLRGLICCDRIEPPFALGDNLTTEFAIQLAEKDQEISELKTRIKKLEARFIPFTQFR